MKPETSVNEAQALYLLMKPHNAGQPIMRQIFRNNMMINVNYLPINARVLSAVSAATVAMTPMKPVVSKKIVRPAAMVRRSATEAEGSRQGLRLGNKLAAFAALTWLQSRT